MPEIDNFETIIHFCHNLVKYIEGIVTNMKKKLYRVAEGKKIAGVCTGLAEYTGVDVSIIRILWLVAIFGMGVGILLYVIMALVLPEKSEDAPKEVDFTDVTDETKE